MVTLCDGHARSLCDFCNNRNNRRTCRACQTGRRMDTLLFIEDDDGIRLALGLALEDEGYTVVEAPTAAEGLAAFRANDVDLVLLDLRLPDMSGFDVCRAIR